MDVRAITLMDGVLWLPSVDIPLFVYVSLRCILWMLDFFFYDIGEMWMMPLVMTKVEK